MIAFGPIPSRRFGKSLGINNIPPHVCSFSCVYCQVGRTTRMALDRENFYPPETIFKEVKDRLEELRSKGERVDYFTFVPDGEPTLDKRLGETILLLKSLNVKIAVVTNSTLLWDEGVRRDLSPVDWVSVKVDAVTEDIWRRLNRPHGGLELSKVLAGLSQFRREFDGRITSETMLINGLNDKPKDLREIASFLKKLNLDGVYLSLPTRPPAEDRVFPAKRDAVEAAVKIFRASGLKVECLFREETAGFGHTRSLADDILGIVSVHPMEESAVRSFVREAKGDWSLVESLVAQGKLEIKEFEGKKFFKTFGGLKPG